MPLREKAETLRVQLGIASGLAIVSIANEAVEKLGLHAQAKGRPLVQQIDICLAAIEGTTLPMGLEVAPPMPMSTLAKTVGVGPEPHGGYVPLAEAGGVEPAPFQVPVVMATPIHVAPTNNSHSFSCQHEGGEWIEYPLRTSERINIMIAEAPDGGRVELPFGKEVRWGFGLEVTDYKALWRSQSTTTALVGHQEDKRAEINKRIEAAAQISGIVELDTQEFSVRPVRRNTCLLRTQDAGRWLARQLALPAVHVPLLIGLSVLAMVAYLGSLPPPPPSSPRSPSASRSPSAIMIVMAWAVLLAGVGLLWWDAKPNPPLNFE